VISVGTMQLHGPKVRAPDVELHAPLQRLYPMPGDDPKDIVILELHSAKETNICVSMSASIISQEKHTLSSTPPTPPIFLRKK
jgi:hypothetical protein